MIRKNESKPRYDLISFKALHLVARVATMGAAKHGENDWREGPDPLTSSQAFGAMMRHIQRLIDEPDGLDNESHLPHIAHVIWNAMAIAEIQALRPGLYDLPEVVK